MADLNRIKANVSKMAQLKAPEADIDGYIASEGVTVDQVRDHQFKGYSSPQEAQQKQSQAQIELRRAQLNSNPFKVASDVLDSSKKDLPFGNPQMPLSPRNILGEASKGLSLLPGVGSAMSGASYMAGQSLEDKDKPLTMAAKTVAGAAGGKFKDKALSFLSSGIRNIPKGIEYSSGRIINSLIRPLLKDFSYGKNPGLQVAKEGITASNLDELAAKIAKVRNDVGKKISQAVNHPTVAAKVADYSNLTAPLDKALAEASRNPRTNAAIIQRLNNLKKDILGITEDEWGNIVSQKDLTKLTPAQASEIKTMIGDLTKWTGNQSDDQIVNKALKQVYGALKEKINAVVPELKKLNERYANLTTAKIATEYRDKILQRQNIVGLVPKIAGYGSLLAGLGSGNPALLLAGVAEIGVDKLLASPALKTRLAAGLAKLSKSDIMKVFSKFPQLNKGFKNNFLDAADKDLKNISKFNMPGNVGEVYAEPIVTKRPAPYVKASQKEWPQPDIETPTGPMSGNANAAAAGILGGSVALKPGIDMKKIDRIESDNDPKAVSSRGAVGVEQITKPALIDFNKAHKTSLTMDDMKNPDKNKRVGHWYMNTEIPRLLRKFKISDTQENRLRAYNQGIGSLKKGHNPKETQDYVRKYTQ